MTEAAQCSTDIAMQVACENTAFGKTQTLTCMNRTSFDSQQTFLADFSDFCGNVKHGFLRTNNRLPQVYTQREQTAQALLLTLRNRFARGHIAHVITLLLRLHRSGVSFRLNGIPLGSVLSRPTCFACDA